MLHCAFSPSHTAFPTNRTGTTMAASGCHSRRFVPGIRIATLGGGIRWAPLPPGREEEEDQTHLGMMWHPYLIRVTMSTTFRGSALASWSARGSGANRHPLTAAPLVALGVARAERSGRYNRLHKEVNIRTLFGAKNRGGVLCPVRSRAAPAGGTTNRGPPPARRLAGSTCNPELTSQANLPSPEEAYS